LASTGREINEIAFYRIEEGITLKKYTLGLYEKAMPEQLSWREKLIHAKEADYDFMEMSIDETDHKLARLYMSKKDRLELIRLMYEVELPIRSICLSGHRKYPLGSEDPSVVKCGLEIAEKTIQLADDLGVRMIMLAGYDVYYEESSIKTKARFEENLKLVIEMAEAAGILLGFETMETEFMNTVQKSMKYVNDMKSAYLNVYPDIGNIMNAAVSCQKDVYEDLKTGESKLIAMHLKETVPGKYRDMMYGEGHVDFQKAIQTAWALNVRRFVTEFWYLGNENWKENLKRSNDFMSDLLDKEALCQSEM